MRHVNFTRLLHRQAQTKIALWVTPTLASRDDDLTRNFGENLCLLGVGLLLAVFDVGPLRMSGHTIPPMHASTVGPRDRPDRRI